MSKEIKLIKCGCSGFATHRQAHDDLPENHPTCIVHETCEVVETPDLQGRKARCDYYGKPVKKSMYNSNCCDVCKAGENCNCKKPSSTNLWFFESRPDKEYDKFYCGCHGCD